MCCNKQSCTSVITSAHHTLRNILEVVFREICNVVVVNVTAAAYQAVASHPLSTVSHGSIPGGALFTL